MLKTIGPDKTVIIRSSGPSKLAEINAEKIKMIPVRKIVLDLLLL